MDKQKLATVLEVIAGLAFIIASLFMSNMTGLVVDTPPATNERIGGFIVAGALVLTSIFVWVKWGRR